MSKNKRMTSNTTESGFTLVEVAIGLLIIALLIGGVLKGQELIINSQVNATAAQVRSIKAGIRTFQDSYQGYPGDLIRAAARLPNCGACVNGNGNRLLESPPNWITGLFGAPDEATEFWRHLNAVDLVGGVSGQFVAQGGVWGETLPTSPLGGGFVAGYAVFALIPGATGNFDQFNAPTSTIKMAHYLTLRNEPFFPATSFRPQSTHLSPRVAERLDFKMDDGLPNTGSLVAAGGPNCATGRADAATYDAAAATNNCAMNFRID